MLFESNSISTEGMRTRSNLILLRGNAIPDRLENYYEAPTECVQHTGRRPTDKNDPSDEYLKNTKAARCHVTKERKVLSRHTRPERQKPETTSPGRTKSTNKQKVWDQTGDLVRPNAKPKGRTKPVTKIIQKCKETKSNRYVRSKMT